MKEELVQDWMSQPVVTVTTQTLLPEVHQLLIQQDIRRVPVVTPEAEDGSGGRLVGMVTLGDVRAAEPSTITSLGIWEMRYLLERLTTDKFMSKNVLTVRPNTTIGTAAQMMLQHRISGLPVVNGKGELVGIITESDIFRMVVQHEWFQELWPTPHGEEE